MRTIAQSFFLDPDLFKKSPHVFLTSIVLYFKKKPEYDFNKSGKAAPGVIVRLVDVTSNGVPNLEREWPRSITRVSYNLISPSSDASMKTVFKMMNPQPMNSSSTYAFVIEFEDPGYMLWTNKSGEYDIATDTVAKVSSGKSDGNMWEVTNGNVITPLVDTDLKYEINFARFTEASKQLKITNEAYEFFRLTSATSGTFIGGEYVYQQQPYATGTVAVTSGSNVVTGTASDFGNTTGSWYHKISNNDLIIVSNNTFSEVRKVGTVTNTTYLTTTSNFSTSGSSLNIRTFEKGTLSLSANNKSVTGTNTFFSTALVAGDLIVLSDGSDGNTQVRKVEVISSNTLIILDYPPGFSNSNAGYYKTAVGKVDKFTALNQTLVLYKSTANSTFYFEPSRIIKGVDSTANSVISNIFNLNLTRFTPNFDIWPVPLTTVSFSVNLANSSYGTTVNNVKTVENNKTFVSGYDGILASRSNEVLNSGSLFTNAKSLSTTVTFTTENEYITNALNENDLDFLTDEFLINNDTSSEVYGNVRFASASFNSNTEVNDGNNFITLSSNKFSNGDIVRYVVSPGNTALTALKNNQPYYVVSANSTGVKLSQTSNGAVIDISPTIYSQTGHTLKRDGVAYSKYVSKLVTLDTDQIAEDLIVYMTAFKPSGTDIEVYARMLNEEDIETFGKKNWTKLELEVPTGSKIYSIPSNPKDYVELKYVIPSSQPGVEITQGSFNVASATNVIVGNFSTVNSYVISGDLVKIYNALLPTEFIVDTVTASNTTTFTISTTIANNDLVQSGAKVDVISNKNSGFLNNQNFNIVRYFNSSMSKFDGYKYFAVKIVLKSDNYYLIPRVQEYRAIALSA